MGEGRAAHGCPSAPRGTIHEIEPAGTLTTDCAENKDGSAGAAVAIRRAAPKRGP